MSKSTFICWWYYIFKSLQKLQTLHFSYGSNFNFTLAALNYFYMLETISVWNPQFSPRPIHYLVNKNDLSNIFLGSKLSQWANEMIIKYSISKDQILTWQKLFEDACAYKTHLIIGLLKSHTILSSYQVANLIVATACACPSPGKFWGKFP